MRRLIVGSVAMLLGVGLVASPAQGAFVPVTEGWPSTVYNGIPFNIMSPWLLVTHQPPSPSIPTYEFTLPSLFHADYVHFLSALAFSDWVTQGTVVGELRGYYTDDSYDSVLLIAGVNTAEWAWDRPGWEGLILHDRTEVGYSYLTTIDSADEYEGHLYYSFLDTDAVKELQRIVLVMSDDIFPDPSRWLDVGVAALTVEGSVVPETSSLAVWSLLSIAGIGYGRWRTRTTA